MAKGKNRPAAEVNSGSMADIAFLLLIFFLVTTTIANDKGIAMLLPPKPDPNEPPPEVTKNDRNIFKIQANSLDLLLVEDEPLKDVGMLKDMIKDFVLNFRKPSIEGKELYNSLPATLRSHVQSKGKKENSSDEPGEAVVSFKADRGTSYELYIRVLDEINAAYNEIYGQRVGITAEEFLQLDKSDPQQNEMYQRARKGIPRAISIAEPNKIGG
ncbi:biopolymer transporter ExbD [Reichenbachiella agarivorans]|uniref:Biopolymer transporter ExbD n=1 Tax=Reichenbachiella agarivorans TaxID=2979464 RepID=A0ABY6CK21_9BACT|nr:biopolymer transporter ExbD [Reichenbachiella agarivorans]UXP30858.1 biopolymer transporter ExbD [Reichenbachiella agarivorans]